MGVACGEDRGLFRGRVLTFLPLLTWMPMVLVIVWLHSDWGGGGGGGGGGEKHATQPADKIKQMNKKEINKQKVYK